MNNNQGNCLKKNRLKISNENKNRPAVIILTGINEQCNDFNFIKKTLSFSFCDNYKVECFNITTSDIEELNIFQNNPIKYHRKLS